MNQFDQKILECFHAFTDPNDSVRIRMSLDQDQRNVVFETYSTIPLAHKMSLEQFLNTPVESLKSMAKGLCREMRVVG
jgi:hypothetical protein|tara:strand:- start:1244 stop:1477 length:234 start_codon:yes stop_codon:yes gene_type:complete